MTPKSTKKRAHRSLVKIYIKPLLTNGELLHIRNILRKYEEIVTINITKR